MSFEDTLRLIVREEVRSVVREELATARPIVSPAPPLVQIGETRLTVAQVAERCHAHVVTVREWIRTKRLPASKPGREWLVRPSDLERFLASPTTGKPQPASVLEQADRIMGRLGGRHG